MRRRRGHLSRAFLLTAAFLLPAGLRAEPAAQALPSAPAVTAGAAEVGVTGAAMVVEQSSDRAVINWRSFSVGRDASVEFRVPSASSATLNRVLGSDPSAVFGSLRSNGTVILVNPNGVLFGASSRVDVGSLVATAHAITDADFMAGRLEFSRSGSGSVVNEGEIRARLGGYVALLAPEVRNAGLIMAQAGTVALAAGERITLNFDPAGSLTGLLVTPSQVAALVENRHAVLASGGRILMSAQGYNALAAGAIRSSGSLDVGAITERGGRVLIEASHEAEVGGSVIASSAVEEGGAVTLAARDVRVSADASIDASGGKAGGQVLLGGGWQGGGWTLQARRSAVGLGAVIDVSVRGLGDGGTAVVWSDVTDPLSLTTVAGRILARGGELGGDGGRVEISGAALEVIRAAVDTRAPLGRTGDWLLDPVNITIADSGGNLTPAQLRAGLLTSNVSISTAGSGSASGVSPTYSVGAGDITISSVIESLSPNSLTLTADNNINVSAVVRMAGALTLHAGNLINLGANVTTGGDQTYNGAVNLTSAVTLSSFGWDVSNYQWLASQGELNARFGGTSATFRVVGGTGAQGGSDGSYAGMAGGASGDYTATVALSGVTNAVLHAGTGGVAGANSAAGTGGGAGGTGMSGYQGGQGGHAGSTGTSGGGGGGGAASVVSILGGTIVGA
ncbi:MAG: filamentous hemagglutinin N-terminal domain-containing protein, partial [Verrucomicrobiota bacterium]